ncbi:hypothetical protein Afil01_29840 [Actinorhabdospora filicis]|uniref:Uncharacterized protein n=1 Tax=Actinorhabdospora filicis TaxID=1785913 RepID=A0A9W6SLL9_9ACTN|nr:hypothetical protein [Actinorhabdospora filicis]GLZ78177.1 hypothetical protein Afil01_29840 [Actinorhabdospora filicis]
MTDLLAALRRADHDSLATAEAEHAACGATGDCLRCFTSAPCDLLRAIRLVNGRDPETGSAAKTSP